MNRVSGQLLGVVYEPHQVRVCADEAATWKFASECMKGLMSQRQTEPILMALTGELGAGKTTWVRGLAGVFGLEEQVHSPTYALKHEYGDPVRLQHLDLYRLNDGAGYADLTELELLDAGLTNPGLSDISLFDAASPHQAWPLITCVEWPERLPEGTVFNHWFHLAFASGEPDRVGETDDRIITWYQPRVG